MVWFWRPDAKVANTPNESEVEMSPPLAPKPVAKSAIVVQLPAKRKAVEPIDCSLASSRTPPPPPTKRIKVEDSCNVATPPDTPKALEFGACADSRPVAELMRAEHDQVADTIQYQFGLEILLKHNELRLINQELAKCQVALEQLRRCHLIPYPTACPTPSQMLDISAGTGAAVSSKNGQAPPEWAPPFGVTDGPYARHYAKWLIPGPKFDGALPEWQGVGGSSTVAGARSTRTHLVEAPVIGKRSGRSGAGQKLQALSAGYPQPKEKAGPCILKKADGEMVKLVCIDCHRDNFSSTQGFINHCRIAHRRDLKSHEQAANICGQPISGDEHNHSVTSNLRQDGSRTHAPSVLVHPLARVDALSEKQTCTILLSRIDQSLKLFEQGKLPGVRSIPTDPTLTSSRAFASSSDVPYLSRFMQSRHFSAGELRDRVAEAKLKAELEPDEEDLEEGADRSSTEPVADATNRPLSSGMRMPAHASSRPVSGGKPAPSRPRLVSIKNDDHTDDEEMHDMDLSPNTLTSNNAPSLVSDDGEYDDSDEGDSASESEADESSEEAEVGIAEDEIHVDTRALNHRGSASSASSQHNKKAGDPHITLMDPISTKTQQRRKTRPRA